MAEVGAIEPLRTGSLSACYCPSAAIARAAHNRAVGLVVVKRFGIPEG
jgi:hypothetical protein